MKSVTERCSALFYLSQVDVSAAAAYIMSPKEDSEILTIKKACLVTSDVFTKYLKDQIMEIIDSDRVRWKIFLNFINSIKVPHLFDTKPMLISIVNYYFRK